MSKSCKNCGSPVPGYADYCQGLACRASLEPEEVATDWDRFCQTWPAAGWHLWQVILAMQGMKIQFPELYEKSFSGAIEALYAIFMVFEREAK